MRCGSRWKTWMTDRVERVVDLDNRIADLQQRVTDAQRVTASVQAAQLAVVVLVSSFALAWYLIPRQWQEFVAALLLIPFAALAAYGWILILGGRRG
jgi:ABC-type spermidine/putrescine transport system permease subunit I